MQGWTLLNSRFHVNKNNRINKALVSTTEYQITNNAPTHSNPLYRVSKGYVYTCMQWITPRLRPGGSLYLSVGNVNHAAIGFNHLAWFLVGSKWDTGSYNTRPLRATGKHSLAEHGDNIKFCALCAEGRMSRWTGKLALWPHTTETRLFMNFFLPFHGN